MLRDYSILISLWIGWCFFHSALADLSVNKQLTHYFGRFTRLFYNGFALISLIPVVTFRYRLDEPVLYVWSGNFLLVQFAGVMLAVVLFFAGARGYDLLYFSGFRQLFGKHELNKQNDGQLSTGGILNIIRHPWYLGGIILIWSYEREVKLSSLLINLVLTAYFVIGARLEERKLIALFGNAYRDYQQRVSMLFPFQWMTSFFKKA